MKTTLLLAGVLCWNAGQCDPILAADFEPVAAGVERHVYVYASPANRQFVCQTMGLKYISATIPGIYVAFDCAETARDNNAWPVPPLSQVSLALYDSGPGMLISAECRWVSDADVGANTSTVLDCR